MGFYHEEEREEHSDCVSSPGHSWLLGHLGANICIFYPFTWAKRGWWFLPSAYGGRRSSMTLKEKAKQKHSFKRYILLVIMRGLWCRPQGRPDCLVFKLPEHSTHSLSPCGEHGLLMWAASGPHSNSFLSTGYRSHRRLTPDAGYHTTGLGVECKWTHTQLACY